MKPFLVYPTELLPMVHLDDERRIFSISGRSIDPAAGQFYLPVFEWLDQFSQQGESTHFCLSFGMELLNIVSYKRILFIMYKLKDMQESGVDVSIEWNYERYDRDMAAIGLDYADLMRSIPFQHIECASLASRQLLKAS